MKIKKTVTATVRAANKANAQCSTGPRTEKGKSASRYNALKHGILTKRVVLVTDEDREEYQKLFESWNSVLGPQGFLEDFLVNWITNVSWYLGITTGLITRELSLRQDMRDQVDCVFHSDLKLPISDWDLPLDRSWECERMVVRAVAAKDESNSTASRGPAVVQNQIISAVQNTQNRNSEETGHLVVEAVLANSFEKMTRYQSARWREFYQAIDKLRDIQAERHKRERGDSVRSR